MEHQWEWVDHEERFFFGDPDKPYAVDIWRCYECSKVVYIRGCKDPAPGKCPGRKGEKHA